MSNRLVVARSVIATTLFACFGAPSCTTVDANPGVTELCLDVGGKVRCEDADTHETVQCNAAQQRAVQGLHEGKCKFVDEAGDPATLTARRSHSVFTYAATLACWAPTRAMHWSAASRACARFRGPPVSASTRGVKSARS